MLQPSKSKRPAHDIDTILPPRKTLKLERKLSGEKNCVFMIAFQKFEGASELQEYKDYYRKVTTADGSFEDGDCFTVNSAKAGETYKNYSKEADHHGNKSYVKIKIPKDYDGVDIMDHKSIKLEEFENYGLDKDDETASLSSTSSIGAESRVNYGPVACLDNERMVPKEHECSKTQYFCADNRKYGCNKNLKLYKEPGKCIVCEDPLKATEVKIDTDIKERHTSRIIFRPFN